MTAEELAVRYQAGALSPVDVARQCLDRCHAIQSQFNAFTHIDRDEALAAAAASEARWRTGASLSPIDGVPTTIKDIVWVRDVSIRYGTLAAEPVVAREDAPSIRRLRAAGAVFVGVTTSPEFGWKALTESPGFGETLNPWNLGWTPGGSSGGAAVAAATGCAPLNIGTDGGGSIRIPASFCGVTGVKPTYGRVAAHPLSVFGTVAHIGPITRSAVDAGLMLDAMSGRDPLDWTQPIALMDPAAGGSFHFSGARVGVWRTPPGGVVQPPVAALFETALERLAARGCELVETPLPDIDARALFEKFWFTGAAARLSSIPLERRAQMDPGFLAIADIGARNTGPDIVAAHHERARLGAALDAWFDDVDIVVSPAVAVAPFRSDAEVPDDWGDERWTSWAVFSFPINLSQQPASATPMGQTADGRPVGIQFIAPRGDDARAVAAAAAWEREVFNGTRAAELQ